MSRRGGWIRRMGGRLARAVGLGALFSISVVAGLLVHLNTEVGRRVLSRTITSLVSGAVPGSLTVERIGALSASGLSRAKAKVRGPDGRTVIEVEQLSARWALGDIVAGLAEGRLPIAAVHGESAWVSLHGADWERLGIRRAFDRMNEPDTGPAQPLPFVLDLERITLERIDVRGAPNTFPVDAVLEDVTARVVVDEPVGVEVRHVRVTTSGAPGSFEIDGDVDLAIETSEPLVVEGGFDGEVGPVPVRLRGAWGAEVTARLDLGPVAGDALMPLLGELSPNVAPEGTQRATLTVHGPVDQLVVALDARLGEAGRVAAGARVREESDGWEVKGRVDLERIDVGALLADAPRSRISGTVVGSTLLGEAVAGELTLQTQAGRVAGRPVPPLEARARYDEGVVTFDAGVDDEGLSGSVAGTLRVDGPLSADAEVRVRDLRLGALEGLVPGLDGQVRGHAQGTADVTYRAADGTAGELKASVDLTADRLRASSSRVGSIRLTGDVAGRVDDLRYDLRGRARDLDVEGRQRFERADLAAAGTLDRGLRIRAEATGGRGLVDEAQARGTLRVGPRQTSVLRPEVTVRRRGTTARVSAERVDLDDGPRVRELQLEAPGLLARGDIQRRGRAWSIDLQADDVSLGRVIAQLPEDLRVDAEGRVSLAADLVVGPETIEGDLEIVGRELVLVGIEGASAELRLRADRGAMDLHAELDGPFGRLSLDADEWRRRGSPFDPLAYLKGTGDLSAEGTLELAALRPLVEASRTTRRAPGDDSDASRWPWPQLDGEVTASVAVSRMPGQSAPEARLDLDLDGVTVKPRGQFERAIDGASWPRDLRFDDLGVELELAAVPSAEAFDLTLRLRDRQGELFRADGDLELPYADLWRGLVDGDLASRLPSDWWRRAPLRLWAELPRRDVDELPWLRAQGEVAGDVRLVATASGTIDEPRAELRLRSFGLDVPDSPLTHPLDLVVIADLDRRRAEGRVKVFAPERQLFIAHGRYEASLVDHLLAVEDASDAWRGSAHLQICELPLSSFAPLGAYRARGLASGTIDLTDVNGSEPKLRAGLEVAGLTLGESRYDDVAIQVGADRRRATMEVEVTQPDGGGLRVDGEMPLRWRDAPIPSGDLRGAQARLEAERFDLGGMMPFVEGTVAELAGRLDGELEARLSGGSRPALAGDLRVSDGRLQLTTLGTRWSAIEAQLTASRGGELRLEELTAQASSGRMRASGEARFDGLSFSEAELSVTIPEDHPIPVVINGQSFGRASLSARARTVVEGEGLATTIDVERVSVELPRVLGRDVTALEPAERIAFGTFDDGGAFVPLQLSPEEQVEDGSSIPLLFDLRIEDAELHRRGLDVWLDGRPRVEVSDRTRLAGVIQIRGGRFDVQGRTFTIEQGRIDFTGRPTDDPIVRVTASWPAPDGSTVIAEYVGPAQTGSVTLRSEPPRPKSEILALLLFGDANHQIGGGDGNTQSQAVGIGGSVVAKGLNEALDDLVALDLTASVDTTSSSNPEAELEWRVARQFSLAISRVLGIPEPGESPDRTYAGIEWQFAHEWSLETTVGDQGSTSVDVTWTHHY